MKAPPVTFKLRFIPPIALVLRGSGFAEADPAAASQSGASGSQLEAFGPLAGYPTPDGIQLVHSERSGAPMCRCKPWGRAARLFLYFWL